MKFELDHVGLAVRDLQESISMYESVLGFCKSVVEEVDEQGVKLAMMTASSDTGATRLELLETTRPGSPIGKFLSTHGPGLHHLALRVDNLEGAIEHLQEQGFEVIGEPQRGAGGCRTVFVHPRSTGGVLLELLQRESL